MSKYTTQVRFICETAAGYEESKGFNDIETILNKSVSSVFSFNYPIFDEAYRVPLEKKILMHYYTREISEETVGLWKLRLNAKMNEIMPYYNKLYESELISFNPLSEVDLTTTKIGNAQGTKNSNSNVEQSYTDNNEGSKTNYNLYSDTPQGALTGVEDEEYLTNARKVTEEYENDNTGNTEGSSTNEESFNNTDEYILRVAGKNGIRSSSKELQEFRKTFLNIDMRIIVELADLFFKLW